MRDTLCRMRRLPHLLPVPVLGNPTLGHSWRSLQTLYSDHWQRTDSEAIGWSETY